MSNHILNSIKLNAAKPFIDKYSMTLLNDFKEEQLISEEKLNDLKSYLKNDFKIDVFEVDSYIEKRNNNEILKLDIILPTTYYQEKLNYNINLN